MDPSPAFTPAERGHQAPGGHYHDRYAPVCFSPSTPATRLHPLRSYSRTGRTCGWRKRAGFPQAFSVAVSSLRQGSRTSPMSWAEFASNYTSGRSGSGSRRKSPALSLMPATAAPRPAECITCSCPWLELVLGQAPPYHLARRSACAVSLTMASAGRQSGAGRSTPPARWRRLRAAAPRRRRRTRR